MNKQDLSEDTQVVLLLCGRFGGEKQEPYKPLEPKEYSHLAKWLLELGLRPSNLMTTAGRDALSNIHQVGLERKRVEFLLGRGTAMALALERWARGGLWVISRGDSEYPRRLRVRLKNAAPPLLYGAGDKALLEKGGLAIVGSRDASESALNYTHALAARCVSEGIAVVSGGARGVDAAGMRAATEAGGYCIGVLASDLLKASVNRNNRIGLQEGRLVLVSPFYPEAGFNAGNAMGRNRYIYTLADQALVVDSDLRKGGTWAGAVENLKYRWVPLYVRTPGEGAGNAGLVEEGALRFTWMTDSTDKLIELFGSHAVEHSPSDDDVVVAQQSLLAPQSVALLDTVPSGAPPVVAQDEQPAAPAFEDVAVQPAVATDSLPVAEVSDTGSVRVSETEVPLVAEQQVPVPSDFTFDMYADFIPKLASLLREGALSEEEISLRLCIEKSQAKAWLKRAIEKGLVEKLKKPVRYSMSCQSSLC